MDIRNPWKIYRGKYCVERFVVNTEDMVKQLYKRFPLQLVTEVTDVLKREHEYGGNCSLRAKKYLYRKLGYIERCVAESNKESKSLKSTKKCV